MANVECDCKLAGYCNRHRVKKATRLVELCRQRGDYWQAWEENRGPGQLDSGRPLQPPAPKPNPWVVLHSRYAAAIESGVWNPAAEQRWHDEEWVRTIPCRGCGSRWADIAGILDLSTAENAFCSSVLAHNRVSTEHVKPPNPWLKLADAYAIYLPNGKDLSNVGR